MITYYFLFVFNIRNKKWRNNSFCLNNPVWLREEQQRWSYSTSVPVEVVLLLVNNIKNSFISLIWQMYWFDILVFFAFCFLLQLKHVLFIKFWVTFFFNKRGPVPEICKKVLIYGLQFKKKIYYCHSVHCFIIYHIKKNSWNVLI